MNIKARHLALVSLGGIVGSLSRWAIAELINSGLNTIVKILSASKEDLLKVEGIKDKSADNILKAINDSIHNIPLFKIMVASNKLGRNVGIHRIKQVLEKYPNILIDYKKWTKKEFIDNLKVLRIFIFRF